MNRPVTAPTPVDYPCSDGQPMAESDFQLEPLVYAITALRTHFHQRKNVYVAGDMFLYHEEGNPRAVVAPDVFVVPSGRRCTSACRTSSGKSPRRRTSSWRSRRAAPGRRIKDASAKCMHPWAWGSTGCSTRPAITSIAPEPRLQGFRLHGGEYRPLPSVAMVGGGLSLHSEALGLDVRLDDEGRLRFHDPASGEDLPAHEEMRARVEQEIAARRATEVRLDKEAAAHRATKARLEEEAAAHRATKARLAELEARLGRAP